MKVLVLNGPNLSRLGTREPDVYGKLTHDELSAMCIAWGKELGLEVEVRQSDSETKLIEWIKQAREALMPVVINPAAFTHYSLELAEVCKEHPALLIEVHISNPHARDEFRKRSVISEVATGTIAGFGANSYRLALIQIASAGA